MLEYIGQHSQWESSNYEYVLYNLHVLQILAKTVYAAPEFKGTSMATIAVAVAVPLAILAFAGVALHVMQDSTTAKKDFAAHKVTNAIQK